MKKILGTFVTLLVLSFLLISFCGDPRLGKLLYDINRANEIRSAGLSEKNVRVNGIHWHYYTRNPDAGSCIVLIHGITAEADHWLRFARYIPEQKCLIIPDLAGFGGSQYRADIDYSYPQQTRRFKDFLDTVAPNQKFDLVGSSGGGFIASLYALENPARVVSLTLMGSPGMTPTHPSAADLYRERTGRWRDDVRTRADFDAALDMVMSEQPWVPESVRNYLADQRIAINKAYVEILTLVRSGPMLDSRLSAIRVPTFIIWGSADQLFDVSMADEYLKVIPGARKLIMPGLGHVPCLERPKETASYYMDFLEKSGRNK